MENNKVKNPGLMINRFPPEEREPQPEPDFEPLMIAGRLYKSLKTDSYSTTVSGWKDTVKGLSENATHYGLATKGHSILRFGEQRITVTAGMFFVLQGEARVDGLDGSGLVISVEGYHGLFQLGGPIEERGRLQYIDGCTDTLLVCPPRLGEPCLNHLHIPPHTSQTAHTHPSERIGVILRGYGECRTPKGVYPLKPGMGWRIPTGSLHSFFTTDESLDVIAWHPDSDFGPTDENHPMINRTIVG